MFAPMLPLALRNPGIYILRTSWLRSPLIPRDGDVAARGEATREGVLHAGLVSQTRREHRDRRSDRRDGDEAGKWSGVPGIEAPREIAVFREEIAPRLHPLVQPIV